MYTGDGIGCNLRLTTHLDVRQLAFLVVCLNPTFTIVNNTHQYLARIDKLTYVNILRANGTVTSGNDVALGEVETGEVDGTTSQFDALLRNGKVMPLFGHNSRLHLT